MQKIFTSAQIQFIDKYTIEHEPISSIDLMEKASEQLFLSLSGLFPCESDFLLFIGPGNNGGDGLAVARMLAENKKQVFVFLVGEIKSKDAKINLQRLQKIKKKFNIHIHQFNRKEDIPLSLPKGLIIDALFGSGLTRPLEGLYKEIVTFLNTQENPVIAIDIPSGLFGEDNRNNTPESIIKATCTLSLEFAKLSFFMPENEIFVGNWQIVPFGLHPDIIASTDTNYCLIESDSIKKIIRPRKKQSHKGTYGHALLIAGAKSKGGAAVLSAKACIRSGAGLLTVHVPQSLVNILQISSPETMLSIDTNDSCWTQNPVLKPFNAIGIGPGIGTEKKTKEVLSELLQTSKHPLVMDADALNILASESNTLEKIPENSILTPHPKEFDRLFGDSSCHYERLEKQLKISKEKKIYIVLKSANTAISNPEGNIYFNNTGNPGMATGGSGDCLTGIILGLLAQQYNPLDACLIGVHLHGMAGDLALTENSHESLIASEIIAHIGNAFNMLYL